MLKKELEDRIGFILTSEEFDAANSQYMDSPLSKDDFSKAFKSYYFATHPGFIEQLKYERLSPYRKAIADITNLCNELSASKALAEFNSESFLIPKRGDFDFYFLIRTNGSDIVPNSRYGYLSLLQCRDMISAYRFTNKENVYSFCRVDGK